MCLFRAKGKIEIKIEIDKTLLLSNQGDLGMSNYEKMWDIFDSTLSDNKTIKFLYHSWFYSIV